MVHDAFKLREVVHVARQLKLQWRAVESKRGAQAGGQLMTSSTQMWWVDSERGRGRETDCSESGSACICHALMMGAAPMETRMCILGNRYMP